MTSISASHTEVTSAHTEHTAVLVASEGWWRVSWLPDRWFDRNEAVVAMIIAATVGEIQDKDEVVSGGHRLWSHLERWADEIGVPMADVVGLVSPSRPEAGPS